MKRNTSKSVYTGLLNEPLPPADIFTTEEEWNELCRLRRSKFELLMRHFDIGPTGPDTFVYLAARLAERHVPGLKHGPQLKRGRPSKNKLEDVNLFLLAEYLKRKEGLSERAACGRIARAGIIQNNAKTLRTRLRNWKRKANLIVEFLERGAKGLGENCLRADGDSAPRHFTDYENCPS